MDRSLSFIPRNMPRVFGLVLTTSALWASPALAQLPADPTQPVDPIAAMAAASASTTSVTTPAAAINDGGQRSRGFAVSLNLISRYNVVSPDLNIDPSTPGPTLAVGGSLFAGFKLDRLVVGLAFDINHTDSTITYVADTSHSSGTRSDTAFLIGPGGQFAILRSQDSKVELIGAAQIEFGRTVTSTSQSPTITQSYIADYNRSNFRVAYQLAPGLRYWAHPQLAVTVLTGLSGDDTFYTQNQPSGLRGDVVNTVSLFGSIGALGVF